MEKKPMFMAALIEASKKKPEGKPESDDKSDSDSDSEPDTSDMGLEAASDACFDALKSNDRAAFKSALKNFIYLCKDSDTED